MDVRLVVGGLLTRNAVLSKLLLNYVDRLEFGNSTATPPRFIVPDWTAEQPPSAPFGHRVLTVQAHTSRADPRHGDTLDAIMELVHVVLTDDHARTAITARRLSAPTDHVTGDVGTVAKLGSWDVAPVPSRSPAVRRRLLPWPDCSTSTLTTGAPEPGTVSMN